MYTMATNRQIPTKTVSMYHFPAKKLNRDEGTRGRGDEPEDNAQEDHACYDFFVGEGDIE
jgi:hypothetical protein